MRGLVAALGAVLVIATASVPAGAKEIKEFEVGQWAGFVFNDDNTGQFVDCTAWAYNNKNIQVGISVNKSWNLDLWLNSDAWDLPGNQSYPISYWIDRNAVYHGKAATESKKFVKIEIERGQAVFDEIRSGSQLTFRTESDDYVFDLRGSNAALGRLIDCVDRYSKTASANPFGGGSSNQQNGGDQESQGGSQGGSQGFESDQQQQNNQQQSSNSGTDADDSATMKLKELTQSTDQVRQFLVSVTGAKPSMISIDGKANKAGYPFYQFSTPIGAGQFWQEHPGNGNLQDLAAGYLSGYKEECKGEFEQSINDPVRGEHGESVIGTAACSSSPYQDNGAEVVSYALSASDNVIAVYVTYVGGNAAKAKTDSLGKLIAKHQEAEIQ